MDRTIAKHLASRGMSPTKPLRKNLTFSERNPDFFKWFHESVMGFDSEEYRREFWREAKRTGHAIGHVPYGLKEYHRRRDTRLEGAAIVLELLVGGSALAVWLIRRMVDRHIQRLRRPTYYETERARRLGLAQERRRIRRRRTTNAMPGKEELLEAFRKAKDSVENMIRFGSLIEDLECYVDNTPYFKDGCLVGRRGGIRRHLEREIPELYTRYKTVMKYKALSKKFRQATGVEDPISAVSLLPEWKDQKRCQGDENSVRNEIVVEERGEAERQGRRGVTEWKANKREFSTEKILAMEILEACEGSIVSLAAQLELRINPNYTPPVRTVPSSRNLSPTCETCCRGMKTNRL